MTEDLVDRLAVQDVMVQYATSVDSRDFSSYGDCFTEDVVVTGFGNRRLEGRASWVAYVEDALRSYPQTQHLIANQVVRLGGATASMRSYVQATHVLARDENTLLVLWATYVDELVRQGDRWRISRHHIEPLIPSSLIQRSSTA